MRLNTGSTALMWASKSGHTEIVKLLLDASADTQIKNNLGHGALDWALEKEYHAIANMLRSAGCS